MKSSSVLQVVCLLMALSMMGCGTRKRDRAESVRLYQEAKVMLDNEDANLADCRRAQELLNRAVVLDNKNIEAYFGKMLNELNLWLPDSAYQTATEAIEQIGEEDVNHERGSFYLMRACVACARNDEVDFKAQLHEALAVYDDYLQDNPTDLNNLLYKAVILSGLEGEALAVDFIKSLPLREADKQELLSLLPGMSFEAFGDTWRVKHEALKGGGQ